MILRFRLLDVTVGVETESEEVARLLALLWAPFSAGGGEPDVVLRVSGGAEREWTVERAGTMPTRHADVWNLVDVLRHYMLNDVPPRGDGFVLLHAGGVARGPRAVLLPGASGAGKTTLARALLDAGWSYLSDDLVPIERSTGLAHPFPKPLGIKDPAAWDAMTPPLGPSGDLPRPAGTFLAPASCWTVATAPVAPTHVVFPSFGPGEETVIRPVPGAGAAARLTAHVADRAPTALAAMAALATGCACFDLSYGTTGAAVAAVQAVVATPV